MDIDMAFLGFYGLVIVILIYRVIMGLTVNRGKSIAANLAVLIMVTCWFVRELAKASVPGISELTNWVVLVVGITYVIWFRNSKKVTPDSTSA